MNLDSLIRRMLKTNRAVREGGMDRRAFLKTALAGVVMAPAIPQMVERVTRPSSRVYSFGSMEDLLRRMAAGDARAREAFAAFIMEPIIAAIEQAPAFSSMYRGPLYPGPVDIPLVLDIGNADEPPPRRGGILPCPFYSPTASTQAILL